MPIPLIVIVAILCLLLMHNIQRSKRIAEERSSNFWKAEAKADTTRKQDISAQDYIKLPMEHLPFGIDTSKEVQEAEEVLHRLEQTQMLNLNQYTNTELKLTYGAANLSFLTECDERFTLLVRTLYQWSCLLLEHGHMKEAIRVAEYSVEIGSDISGCYYMLADYYQADDNPDAMEQLRQSAQQLTGLQAELIMQYLNKSPN